MRTMAEWRGVTLVAGRAEVVVGMETKSPIGECYHVGRRFRTLVGGQGTEGSVLSTIGMGYGTPYQEPIVGTTNKTCDQGKAVLSCFKVISSGFTLAPTINFELTTRFDCPRFAAPPS